MKFAHDEPSPPRRRLGRRFIPTLRLARGPVDAVPLVDAALIVFLFFLVSSAFVLQPGLVVHLPEADFTGGAPYRALVVTVSQEGLIFFQDERTTLEGLSASLVRAARETPESILLIQADQGVPHATLVRIYNAAAAAGIQQVVLGTRPAPLPSP